MSNDRPYAHQATTVHHEAESHLLHHEYDGIREFDNPTPGWWHLLFIGSVVFSIGYVMFWHMSPIGWTPEQAVAWHQDLEAKKLFSSGDIKPEAASMVKLMSSPALMSHAAAMFQTNCAQCHAKDGGGINGVNLTDDYYKNTKTIEGLYKVISEGANNGAMPSWNRFSEKERVLLAAYAASLRGTKPAVSKEPEGEVIPPWPTAASLEHPAGATSSTTTPSKTSRSARFLDGKAHGAFAPDASLIVASFHTSDR